MPRWTVKISGEVQVEAADEGEASLHALDPSRWLGGVEDVDIGDITPADDDGEEE